MVLGHRIGNRERDHTEQHIVGINQYCYYSEKRHLQTYLKPIFGDSYFALLEGPVPSTSYDIIKVIRGEDNSFFKNIAKSVLNFEEIPLRYVKPFYVIGLREANIKSKEDELEDIRATIQLQ